MASKTEVKSFLEEMKANGSTFGFLFADREKNHDTYLELQLTSKVREEVLKNLQPEDYCKGPEKNTEYGTNPMWIFGKELKGKEIYIKITIPLSKVICISFHIAEHSMTYPLKSFL
ncbi:hypothetical protein [Halpernia sp.]|uniref:hypothetical protein n=1 Tax=Halpernia sp. TaxID=2782209 RepID=UPI003A918682